VANLPQAIQPIGWNAHVRVCKRFPHLTARGQHANPGVVASARELAACIWAIAREVPIAR
jgi:transposase